MFLEGKSTREAGNGKYVAGLERLKKQKRRFTPYLERIRDDAIYNEGVKTVSVSRFHQEGISSTERAAFMMIETFEKARLPIPEKYTPYIKGYKQLIEKLG